MPGPTPVFVVSYAGSQLPGYVQAYDPPIVMNSNSDKLFGRDGGIVTPTGAGLRQISMQFYLPSALSAGTGLQHLDSVMDQWRTAAAILTRNYGENPLVIHNTDRYFLATVENITAPFAAGTSQSLRYSVDFTAQPWAISTVAQTGTFSGNGTVTISGMTGSRRTYPLITIPTGVTGFTATDEHGHTVEYLRGGYSGETVIDTAKMEIYRTSNLQPAMATMQNLNFGLQYDPILDGDDFVLTVTGFAGSGTVEVDIPKRYEL